MFSGSDEMTLLRRNYHQSCSKSAAGMTQILRTNFSTEGGTSSAGIAGQPAQRSAHCWRQSSTGKLPEQIKRGNQRTTRVLQWRHWRKQKRS